MTISGTLSICFWNITQEIFSDLLPLEQQGLAEI